MDNIVAVKSLYFIDRFFAIFFPQLRSTDIPLLIKQQEIRFQTTLIGVPIDQSLRT